MRLLFWTATALEWRAACPWHQGPLPEQEWLEFEDPRGRRHYLCITGVGPVNAGMAAGLCMAQLRQQDSACAVTAAVNVGVAGSFDLALAPLGSAWRVRREIFPEYGLASATSVDARALGFAQWQPGGDDHAGDENAVWNSVDLPAPAQGTWACGLAEEIRTLPTTASLTVAGVTADTARAARLYAEYGERLHAAPLLENMEGFALALACARHGLPLLELRTVSNAVGPRHAATRNFPKALAALQPLLRNLLNLAAHG